MTPQMLMACTGCRRFDRAQEFLPLIEAAMTEYEINTDARRAAFLAQIGHESEGLHFTVEIWGPTQAQSRYDGANWMSFTQSVGFRNRLRNGSFSINQRPASFTPRTSPPSPTRLPP